MRTTPNPILTCDRCGAAAEITPMTGSNGPEGWRVITLVMPTYVNRDRCPTPVYAPEVSKRTLDKDLCLNCVREYDVFMNAVPHRPTQ